MRLIIKGEINESTGAHAERRVLDLIIELFSNQEGKIFVNEHIPGKASTPDFVIPVLFDNKLKLIVIECKASPIVHIDGSTDFSDAFAQIKRYEKAMQDSFSKMNREVDIESFVVMPDAKRIPDHLSVQGRDSVIWGKLNELRMKLKDQKLIPFGHKAYHDLDIIYDYNRFLKTQRILIMDKKQQEFAKVPFGGVWKFAGLAGSGKTLILAHKIVNDALAAPKRELLYLTQNKNLVLLFNEIILKRLKDEGVGYVEKARSNDKLYAKTIELSGNGSSIHFAVHDAFPTNFFTSRLDKILFKADSYGPLYKIHREFSNSSNYAQARLQYIEALTPHLSTIRQVYPLFDGLYVDEFQDCLIDGSKALLPMMLTKTNSEGVPNLVFTEDMLQTYVKYKVLKEFDENYQDIKKKDILGYKDLGITVVGRSKKLTTIYRTPKNIFQQAICLLDKTNGLKKDKKDEILNFDFYLPGGNVEILDYADFASTLEKKVREYSPGEIFMISHDEHHRELMSKSSIHWVHRATSKELLQPKSINLLHENNSRGLEARVVFIFVHDNYLENPNYLYTIMCRTQRELILVKMPSTDEKKFSEFIEMISTLEKSA